MWLLLMYIAVGLVCVLWVVKRFVYKSSQIKDCIAIFKDFHVELIFRKEYENFFNLFSKVLESDEGRVEVVLYFLDKYEMMPFKSTDEPECRKHAQVSIDLRNEGNKFFMKNNEEALLMYTRSIAAAPYPESDSEDSEELALAFANRSAVYFVLEKYEACLRDIEQALLFQYPVNLKYKLFERRAKCYHKLGRLDEARTSFEDAIEHLSLVKILPVAEMKSKMDALEILKLGVGAAHCECLEAADVVKPLPQKSFGHHRNISCAASCLDIEYNLQMGRHIVANRDIDPGDILFVEEPFASVLLPECCSTHCNRCLKRSDALIPCTRCDYAMFCSTECREKSWDTCHKVERRLIPALRRLDVGHETLLPLRIFLIACSRNNGLTGLYHMVNTLTKQSLVGKKKGFDENGQYKSLDYAQIHNLHRVSNKEPNSQMTWTLGAACVLNGLDAYSDFYSCESGVESAVSTVELQVFSAGLILKYMEIARTNAFVVTECYTDLTIKDINDTESGRAIYSTLSLLNHSCDPNAMSSFHQGDVHVVMARRPIKKGEGIFITYGDHFTCCDVLERKLDLREKYAFDCNCRACLKHWPPFDDLQPSDNLIFICQYCRTPLPKGKSKSITCTKCNRKHNCRDMERKTMALESRIEEINDEMQSGNCQDFTAELADYIKVLDRTLQTPNQLLFKCDQYLWSSQRRSGNHVIRR